MSGSNSSGATPVYIPNTEVKSTNADDTVCFANGKVGSCRAFFNSRGCSSNG